MSEHFVRGLLERTATCDCGEWTGTAADWEERREQGKDHLRQAGWDFEQVGLSALIPTYRSDNPEDPEVFCGACFAGMGSNEHHEKCVAEVAS